MIKGSCVFYYKDGGTTTIAIGGCYYGIHHAGERPSYYILQFDCVPNDIAEIKKLNQWLADIYLCLSSEVLCEPR